MEVKSVIDKLEAYFMTQDKQVVSRMLAGCICDINRFHNLSDLGVNELSSLLHRTELNLKELYKFLKEDTNEDLKLIRMNSEDE